MLNTTDRFHIPSIILLAVALLLAFAVSISGAHGQAIPQQKQEKTYAHATFAGGCFWCMEPPFDKLDGVISTTSGYTGGHTKKPSYKQVSAGTTGHRESIQVTYDPDKISYEKLLEVFWHNIDPLDSKGQFCDKGFQYTSAIYTHNAEQKAAAEKSLQALKNERFLNQPIATVIEQASIFYPAEDYHQDYYLKNPIRYKYYRYRCGRDARLKELWGHSPN